MRASPQLMTDGHSSGQWSSSQSKVASSTGCSRRSLPDTVCPISASAMATADMPGPPIWLYYISVPSVADAVPLDALRELLAE